MITEKCTLFIIRIIELEIDTDITKRISQPHTVAAVRKIIGMSMWTFLVQKNVGCKLRIGDLNWPNINWNSWDTSNIIEKKLWILLGKIRYYST